MAAFGGPGQPNFSDISGVVSKFQSLPGAPMKVRAQLQPNVPDPSLAVSFADISQAVDAFRREPYPFAGPTDCP